MNLFASFSLLTVTSVAALTASRGVVQDTTDRTPTQAEMAKIATLGELSGEHRRLKTLLGTWNIERREWRAVGQPEPAVTTGTCENKAILGGRYVQMSARWKLSKRFVESMTLVGFDRRSEEYSLVSLDSNRTWFDNARGTWKSATRNIAFETTDVNAMTQTSTEMTFLLDLSSSQRWKLTVYEAKPRSNGARSMRRKTLEIVATRRHAARSGR